MDNRERSNRPPCAIPAEPELGGESSSRISTESGKRSPTLLRAAADFNTSLPADAELFPIRTVSSLTGVNSITLRAWERRYGLVRPIRTPTGHRLYRRDEIDLIHRVVALLDKGISISQVKRVLSQSEQPNIPEHETAGGLWLRLRRRTLTAVARFDDDALDDIHHEALGIASIQEITKQLLVPVWDALATQDAVADDNVAEGRFFGTYLRNRLGARLQHRPRGINGPRLLGACLPGERNDVGLVLFAAAAQEVGLRSLLLGTDVPLGAVNAAARRAQCNAVLLDGSTQTAPDILTEQLPRLTADLPITVFARGIASIHRRDQIVAAGAVPLGNDLTAGVERIVDMLSARERQQLE
jgi:DNA-binding transcriptional MerR regulator